MYSQAPRPLLLIILVCGAKVYFLRQEKNNQQLFIAKLRLNIFCPKMRGDKWVN